MEMGLSSYLEGESSGEPRQANQSGNLPSCVLCVTYTKVFRSLVYRLRGGRFFLV
jgi:hypothetical protein